MQPGNGQQPVPRPDLEACRDIADQVDHADVVDHHALGLTRRARSENRVREVRRGLRGVGPGLGPGLEVLVHPVAAGRGGPADPGVQPGLGEDPVDLGLGEQAAQPLRRHGRVQRQIGGAGGEDPVHRGVLLPALLHHHGDQLARGRPVVPQRVPDPPGVRGQLGVAEPPPGGVHHGLGAGGALHLLGEQLVQGGVGDLPGGVVDLAAQRPLGRRDQVEAPGVQGLRVPREPLQEVHVHAEGGVDEAGRERPVDEVPDDAQLTGQFAQLYVERDLRGLRDRVHLPAQVRDGPAHRVVEQAGHDHRHAGLRAHPVQPGQLAQHPDAVEGAVLRVAGELVAQGVRPVQEGRARTVGGEHNGVGEVTEDAGDVRVHRRALEDRVVDGEVGLLRPAPDHLGEGGGEQDRRRQPRLARPRGEALPVRGGEAVLAPVEAHLASAAGGAARGQRGGRRQGGDALHPVVAGGAEGLGVRQGVRTPASVLREADAGLREFGVRVLVQVDQLGEEHLEGTGGVQHLQVDPEVDPAQVPRTAQPDDPQVEQRPAAHREDHVAHLVPQRGEPLPRGVGGQLAQVHDRYLEGQRVRRHPLGAVRAADRAEHVVTGDHLAPGGGETLGIEVRTLPLEVSVAADTAQLDCFTSPDHQCLLRLGHREGRGTVRASGQELGHGPTPFGVTGRWLVLAWGGDGPERPAAGQGEARGGELAAGYVPPGRWRRWRWRWRRSRGRARPPRPGRARRAVRADGTGSRAGPTRPRR